MAFANIFIRNAKQILADVGRVDEARKKAGFTVARVEGFRMQRELKAELRKGMAGGQALDPLSEIAKNLRESPGIKPLSPLRHAVRYRADREKKGSQAIRVGFIDPGKGDALSKSWKAIAEAQQEGFSSSITARQRRMIVYWGSLKSPRSQRRKKSMLRKTTRTFTTPARPIIEPFWRAQEPLVSGNMRANFKKKMAGERI